MKLTMPVGILLLVSLLGLAGGSTAGAQQCNLTLPCESAVSSSAPALSITNTGEGPAARFSIDNNASGQPALVGITNSAVDRASGVFGAGPLRGIVGIGRDPGSTGIFGEGLEIGVSGFGRAGNGTGVQGRGDTGVHGTTTGSKGVFGESTGPTGGIGVHGKGNARGVVGTQGETSCAGTYAVGGCATTGIGVFGRGTNRAIVGTQGSTSCAGVYGVGGCATSGDGVLGRSQGGRAGRFVGNVLVEGNMTVTGNLVKGSGSFKIDHPLDPENQYLYHSFVESPDMLNIYSGNTFLDGNGEAWVELPGWFDAVNREIRYQLTPIGAPAPSLHVAERVSANRFRIAGGQDGLEISWQVTGVRHDRHSEMNRVPVEEWKPERERGRYLHPAAYGKPPELGVDFDMQPEPAGDVQQIAGNGR